MIDSRGNNTHGGNFFIGQIDSLKVGEKYTLLIEKSFGAQQLKFDFNRLTPVTNSRSAAVGELISGVLAGRGDRQIIELDLTAGQLIQLTSNLDPLNAQVRWLDIHVNNDLAAQGIDPARPDRIANTRKYHVED